MLDKLAFPGSRKRILKAISELKSQVELRFLLLLFEQPSRPELPDEPLRPELMADA
jgi:hypothetical protein